MESCSTSSAFGETAGVTRGDTPPHPADPQSSMPSAGEGTKLLSRGVGRTRIQPFRGHFGVITKTGLLCRTPRSFTLSSPEAAPPRLPYTRHTERNHKMLWHKESNEEGAHR